MIERLPPLALEDCTPAQRAVAQAVIDGPRGALVGPFVPLLRSPELMEHAQRMGEYLRYRSAVGTRLSELVILLVARAWDQEVEWAIHAPIALQAGLAQATVDAIARRATPTGLADDEAAVHTFCTQLLSQRRVDDVVYARALDLFGEQGVVDLTGLCGYYSLLAMVMNVAQTPAPASTAAPLPQA